MAVHGAQSIALLGPEAQLQPDRRDVRVQGPRRHLVVPSPDGVHQVAAGQHPPDLPEQAGGQVEFARLELDRHAVLEPVARGRAPFKGTMALHTALLGIGATQQGQQARLEFGAAHRLDDVVVGALGQSLNDVPLRIAVGDHHDGHAGALGAHRLHDLHAGQAGQLPVHQQQVEGLAPHRLQQARAVGETVGHMPHRCHGPRQQL